MVPEAGGESDTTILAVDLSNRGLGLRVAASYPGLESRRSVGEPPGAKGRLGWGWSGEKPGKLAAQSSPGARRLARVLRDHSVVFSVCVGQ